MKPRHSSYANAFRVTLMFVLMLPLFVHLSTAGAAASRQDLPEPDAPTNPHTTDPTIAWNTFLGLECMDFSTSIDVDGSGNIYLTGSTSSTSGEHQDSHGGGTVHAFVAKLDTTGVLQWHSFLGSNIENYSSSIAVDEGGNVYVVGSSWATWGSPINAHAGSEDTFVAMFDSSGVLQWHTFLGSSSMDTGVAIAIDGTGDVYLTGSSEATWGSPINPHAENVNSYGDLEPVTFVAKLTNGGALLWNTFLGTKEWDKSTAIAVDESGNVYVLGSSFANWGNPINPHTESVSPYGDVEPDTFVAKLTNGGALQWNTFLGSTKRDFGNAIAVDQSENIYLVGSSWASWGNPINAYAGGGVPDAFVSKLDSNGGLKWNTFLGTKEWDEGNAIAIDDSGNVFIAGNSEANWGSPINANAGGNGLDAFVAKLNSSGVLLWNSFVGSPSIDFGYSIAIDGSGDVYLAGSSDANWGSPVIAHSGRHDAFVVKFADPENDVQGNKSSGWIYWCALLVLGGCLAILLKNSKRLSKSRLK